MITNWQRFVEQLSDDEKEQLGAMFNDAKSRGFATLGIEFKNYKIHLFHLNVTVMPRISPAQGNGANTRSSTQANSG